MNVERDPDAILAAWLEQGPDRPPRTDATVDRGQHSNHDSTTASDLDAAEENLDEHLRPMGGRGDRDRPRGRRCRVLPGACRRPGRRTSGRIADIVANAVATRRRPVPCRTVAPSPSPSILGDGQFVYPARTSRPSTRRLTFTIDREVRTTARPASNVAAASMSIARVACLEFGHTQDRSRLRPGRQGRRPRPCGTADGSAS